MQGFTLANHMFYFKSLRSLAVTADIGKEPFLGTTYIVGPIKA